MNEFLFMQDMSDNQKMMFQSKYLSEKKDTTTAVLLALFVGGLGVHWFYLGRTGKGVLYLLMCWTFLPAIAALFEAITMSNRINQMNQETAARIAAEVKSMG